MKGLPEHETQDPEGVDSPLPPAPATPGRLQFPTRVPLGNLHVRLPGGDWKFHGPAAGNVDVPPGAEVRLELTLEGLDGGRNLARIPHLGIHVLEGRRLPLRRHEVEALANLQDLRILSLPHCTVRERWLRRFEKLPKLERLDLTGTWIDDESMADVAAIRTLRALNISTTAVGDAGIATLKGHPALESLRFPHTEASDGAVAGIVGLEHLREVELPERATDQSIYLLRAFPELRSLLLTHANPSPTALASLYEVPKLEFLSLGETIGDSGVGRLHMATQLRFLWLESEDVTAEGLGSFARGGTLEMLHCHAASFGIGEVRAIVPLRRLRNLSLPKADLSIATLDELSAHWWIKDLRIRCGELRGENVRVFDRFHHLERLHLHGSSLTPHDIEILENKLPKVRITHEGRRVQMMATPEATAGAGLTCGVLFMREAKDSGSKPWLRAVFEGGRIPIPPEMELSYRCAGSPLHDISALGRQAGDQVVELKTPACNWAAADADSLLQMRALRTLEVPDCVLAEEFYRALPRLGKLTKLSLNGTLSTDEHAHRVAECPFLVEVEMKDTLLGDIGLVRMARMPHLARLDIGRTSVTMVGVKRFRRLRPEVEISF